MPIVATAAEVEAKSAHAAETATPSEARAEPPAGPEPTEPAPSAGPMATPQAAPEPSKAPEDVEPSNAAPNVAPSSVAPLATRPEPVPAIAVVDTPAAKLDRLRDQAAEAVVTEARILTRGRSAAEGILATSLEVISALHPAAKRAREAALKELAQPGSAVDMDQVIRRLAALSKNLEAVASATERLMAQSRLMFGAPGKIEERRQVQEPSPPPDPALAAENLRQLAAALYEANRTLDAEGRPIISVEGES